VGDHWEKKTKGGKGIREGLRKNELMELGLPPLFGKEDKVVDMGMLQGKL